MKISLISTANVRYEGSWARRVRASWCVLMNVQLIEGDERGTGPGLTIISTAEILHQVIWKFRLPQP